MVSRSLLNTNATPCKGHQNVGFYWRACLSQEIVKAPFSAQARWSVIHVEEQKTWREVGNDI